ncbi:helix-turn-helix domain-containing protein [Wolbachia endosymbiont of Folsomia candida]|uniref:helix-turn-helix domain-containing protein n=1 Tax=Wolbachia endosymbiont of Folsomia candida TaxID=169402 RepID=UPI000B128D89|nr:helix-turn-helix transcriptional regulator [Wolbachia endosymbiont of Folsomia candida]APR98316.1 XRE family transcriptional regulator [Wolbachia endosymbiont of Folsomia candida]
MNVDNFEIKERAKTNFINLEIGKKIRELRLTLGMTQSDLGKLVGITFQQIQKYEKGINSVLVGRLYDLAIALRTTPEYFFSNISNPTSDSLYSGSSALHEDKGNFEYNHSKDDAESKEILGLVREYQKIKNKKSRNAVYSLIKSLSYQEN